MLKRFSFCGLIALFLGVSSCETDFSLNGKYEPIPVVFGLLDHQDTTHLIKITKAFLGDGDNLVYAKNPDSNYFAQVDAQVIEYDVSGDKTGREWQLEDSIITNKSTDGIFYGPDQKIYYFVEPDLNSGYTYEIVADINEGEHSFSGQTSMINNFNILGLIETGAFKLNFAKNNVTSNADYFAWSINFTAENAGQIEMEYTFLRTEHYESGDSAKFSSTKIEGQIDEAIDNETVRISGIDFYRWIEQEIPTDENVEQRTFDGFDLHFSLAHKNLDQYMTVAQPVTGIAQVQPIFTNITGGYGLFSSRLLYTIEDLPLNAASMKELARGQFTLVKAFCSRLPIHNTSSFYCD